MKFNLSTIPKLVALSAGIFLLIALVNWLLGSAQPFGVNLLFTFLFTLLYTLCLYFVNAAVFAYLDRKFVNNRFSAKRIVLGFVGSFLASLLVIFLLRILEDVVIERRSFAEYIANEEPGNYIFAIVITFFITLVGYAVGFYKAYKENQIKQQKIIAGTASAQFETLKNQIDPHFLFNSLNVLSSLIEENPESAQKFTTSLSKVYRYVLEQKDKELVSVEEELSFARTYMNLLKMRFENSLFYELPGTLPDAESKVVPLSLQLLLENTVKHNVVSEQRPLRVRIYIENDYLCIQNDLQKKEVLRDRQGVGLQNIVNRYAIITRRAVLVEENEKTFTVKIPILTKQITILEAQFNEEQTSYYHAQKKVEELKGFYGNLASYIIFIGGLMALNLITYSDYLWFLWPAAGWGIGVVFHALKVFNYMPFLGSDWEEKKIREIMEKEKTNKWQ